MSSQAPTICLNPLPQLPGILSMLQAFPDTGKVLSDLAQQLLVNRASETFTQAERETIATLISSENKCLFCTKSHASIADICWKGNGFAENCIGELNEHHFSGDYTPLIINPTKIPTRLFYYMVIAKNVHRKCKTDLATYIDAAKKTGATDADIHDLVLIVAAFGMYNLYVDTLAPLVPPKDSAIYQEIGQKLAQEGYALKSASSLS